MHTTLRSVLLSINVFSLCALRHAGLFVNDRLTPDRICANAFSDTYCSGAQTIFAARGAASRKPASFAVARNCGTGSSSLKALVKAFERLHIVRAWNSSNCGLK